MTTEFDLPLAGISDHHPADRRPADRRPADRRPVTTEIVVGTAVAAVAVAAIRARKAHTADSDRDSALFVYNGQWLTISRSPYSRARLYFE